MDIYIEKIDSKDKNNQKQLIDFLAKDEEKALFLIGNLVSNLQPSHIYVAKKNARIVGVCGYYPSFKSCSIYSQTEEASIEFANKIISLHSIEFLLGMKNMVKPAYDQFLKRGMKSIVDPELEFLKLDLKDFKPYFTLDGKIVLIETKDIDTVVMLQRQIHNISKEIPVTEQDRLKVIKLSIKFGLKIDDKLVCIASSNGLGIKAFQILGVATDPNFQKKGYAKAVCSHLITYMKERGADKAILFTRKENVAAMKCYLDLGFKIVDKYYFAIFAI